MKIAVTYCSKSGNTKKIADAIAKEAGISANSVEKNISEPIDVLFIGGGVYAGKLDSRLSKFVQTLSSKYVKNIVSFSSSASKRSIQPLIAELITDKKINILKDDFSCKGKFLLAHRSHPDAQDCKDAASFTKKTIESLKG